MIDPLPENTEAAHTLLDERGEHLSEWEEGFLASILDQMEERAINLTEKQQDTLDRLWKKLMG